MFTVKKYHWNRRKLWYKAEIEQAVVQACLQNGNVHTNSPSCFAKNTLDLSLIKTGNLEMSTLNAPQYVKERTEDFKLQQSD